MDDVRLTASEWNILNCLWEHSPQTVMQLVGELEKTVGWARSTTITTLHRMEAKGLVRCERAGRGTAYVPRVERDRAALAETRSFLDRVYQGSVGMMMSAMARQEGLSREQIAQLRAILDQAEQEAEG
ncbi:MAG: BlaI/MecI/CopY family transcriptional regulator [Oscillospiraceae bacterium]|nr:BlaI/MecI/CopY family transcriptional regulator [Oscillospiraceae bacterium]